MTAQATRQTAAGRAYLDLQNLARRQRRPTDELHQFYALEGFLRRLVSSPHKSQFVLKGGVLLAAFDARRPTRDIDLQAQGIPNELPVVQQLICGIAELSGDDGLTFSTREAFSESIRDEDEYSGVRVTLSAALAGARMRLHVDVNVGDPIWPAPSRVLLPGLLGGMISISGYPLHMVVAEKAVTALQRGTANTRWRDFADLFIISETHEISGANTHQAIAVVAAHRRVPLISLTTRLDEFASLAQSRWMAWRRRQRLEDRVPENFQKVLDRVTVFLDPVVTGKADGLNWKPDRGAWL